MIKSTSNLSINETKVRQLLASLDKRMRKLHIAWREAFKCKNRHEVDPGVTELYIIRGYREERKPWSYYLKSIFFPNNQSMNVWTHFIPLLCFIHRFIFFCKKLDNPLNPINYPFYVHGMGVCFSLFASSAAHTFCSRSKCSSRTCFGADFAAIYQYGISFVVGLESYMCPIKIHCGGPSPMRYFTFTVILTTLATGITLYINTVKRGASPYIRSTFYVIAMAIAYLPCTLRFASTESRDITHPTSSISGSLVTLFFFQMACLVLACFFYVGRFPEARFSGVFDILGHSHHWFHLLSALAMYAQSLMLECALNDLKVGIKKQLFPMKDLEITWPSTFGVFFTSFILLSWVVAVYGYVICKSLKSKET